MTVKKEVPASFADRLILVTVLGAWSAGLIAILAHRVFVTNDSLNNYAHVWYAAERLRHGHGIPFRFPQLGHGDALAFPYGFLPWVSAALFRPLLGDWVVTLWLVLGAAGLLATMWWTFPEIRRPLLFAAVMLNPFLVEAVMLAQLPFVWATAMLFVAVGAWRRGHPAWAAVVAGAAQATHPAVLVPLLAILVVGRLRSEPRRRALVTAYACSLVLAAPAIVLVVLSPVVEDSSLGSLMTNFVGTVSLRGLVVAGPFALAAIARRGDLAVRVTAAAFLVLNVALVPVRDTAYAWGALVRTPDNSLETLLRSPDFVPGATYRLLRIGDGKVGMYQVLKSRGRLDSEFFPESFDRRSWSTTDEYRAFLSRRHVDFVIIFDAYTARYRTNEMALLDSLASLGCASLVRQDGGYTLFRIERACG